jgi:hypothetical protein
MNWIVDHFQIVIAVVGGVVYFWNQFRQAKNEEREATRRHEEEMANGYEPVEPDEEPVESYQPAAPPQLPPRLPSRRDFTDSPPLAEPAQNRSVLANQRELERQANLQERLRILRATKAKTTGGASATQAQRKPVAQPVAVRGMSLKERLRDKKEIRQAILMREILGPPVGLK